MSFSRLSLTSGALVYASSIYPLAAQGTADLQLEQRIQRIQAALLPPVVVKGEAVQNSSLAERMTALKVPGVSIAVIHKGKIEWARGFGVTKTGGPAVTPATLFQAASISKPVTALAVLHLVQEGKLDLDTDVNRYLKSWKLPDNEFTATQKVTLRELLTHTAGMTVHGFPGYSSTEAVPTTVQVLNGEKPANSQAIRVAAAPRTKWEYSGGGYVIVQQLLEDVTGKPFPRIMQETVLGPIAMASSTYQQPLQAERLKEVAMPYRQNGDAVAGGPHTYPEMAAAGLWTTPSDLARYAMEVQQDLAGTSNRVLSTAMTKQMLTPGMNKQGLGPGTGGSAEHPYFTHSGANEGYQCNLVAYNDGDGAVIMTNSDSGGQLATEILRTIAYEYKWPDFQPSERTVTKTNASALDAYAGGYQLAPNAVLTVTREGDQMFTQLTGQPKLEMFPKGDREFFLKVVDAQLTFDIGADGKATQVTLHQNGRDLPAPRLSEAEAKRAADAQAAIAKRFQDQTKDSRAEPALRRLVEGLRAGAPNYDEMVPSFADVTRNQLPQLQATVQQLGAIESITFKGVGPGGADIYEMKCEKGGVEARIMVNAEGKIQGVGIRPL